MAMNTHTDNQRQWDAIVIGSGMGGLAAAALLARLYGRRVLVLERHYRAGGFTHVFHRRGGFRWDVGVHYVGEMGPGETARELMDVVTGGAVRWQPLPDPFDRLIFPGFTFDIRAGKQNFRADLEAAFPDERAAIARYFHDVERAADYVDVLGMRGTAPRLVTALVEWLKQGAGRLARQTTGAWLDTHVRDPRLKAVLGARWPNYGLPPAESAFLIHALVTRHFFEGGYYPVGSSEQLATAAEQVIAGAGGRIRVRAEVERILVDAGRATGVRLTNGEVFHAPLVISNVGARNTYLRLLPPELPLPVRDTIATTTAGMVHLSLYLGLKETPASIGMRGENLWIHDGLDQDRLWADKGLAARGQIAQLFVSFPSLKDPEARRHTAELITLADAADFAPFRGTAWMKRGPAYAALKQQITEALLASAERHVPGLRDLVAWSELSTPLSTEHFTAHPYGEIYGMPLTPERLRQRWHQSRTPVRGLLLAGADALTLGIVGALRSGLLAVAAAEGPLTFWKVASAARRLRRGSPPIALATSPSIA